jgi:hypothetical protein
MLSEESGTSNDLQQEKYADISGRNVVVQTYQLSRFRRPFANDTRAP